MERMERTIQCAGDRGGWRARNVNGIRSSVVPGSDRIAVPAGASRRICYGDRIFVRVVDLQRGWSEVANFLLTDVADLSEVYGELRHRTMGRKGLVRVTIRNASRGWTFDQTIKLYGRVMPSAGVSVTRPVAQLPAQGSLFSDCETGKRRIPDSIRTYDL